MKEKATTHTGRPHVVGVGNDLCVWSRAGVVKAVKCMNAFDCLGCAFDHKVQSDFKARQGGQGAGSSTGNTRMRLLIKQLKCRHMLSGRVSYKLCGHGYDCIRCPYDQMLEDTAEAAVLAPPSCENVSGFTLARDYYYHHGHTWARVEYGGRVRIGMDDFALRLLGPQDAIELPELGTDIHQGEPHARVSRGPGRAETLSPIDGKVLAVNHRASAAAAQINDSPYAAGWLMVVQPSNLRPNLKNLLYGKESASWYEDEADRLNQMIGGTSDYRLAATGGEAIRDIYGCVPGLDWERLVREFLG